MGEILKRNSRFGGDFYFSSFLPCGLFLQQVTPQRQVGNPRVAPNWSGMTGEVAVFSKDPNGFRDGSWEFTGFLWINSESS